MTDQQDRSFFGSLMRVLGGYRDGESGNERSSRGEVSRNENDIKTDDGDLFSVQKIDTKKYHKNVSGNGGDIQSDDMADDDILLLTEPSLPDTLGDTSGHAERDAPKASQVFSDFIYKPQKKVESKSNIAESEPLQSQVVKKPEKSEEPVREKKRGKLKKSRIKANVVDASDVVTSNTITIADAGGNEFADSTKEIVGISGISGIKPPLEHEAEMVFEKPNEEEEREEQEKQGEQNKKEQWSLLPKLSNIIDDIFAFCKNIRGKCHIIVVGNEKGGSGKTTTAMHLIAVLMYEGMRVGSVDLDGRQRSLTRYIENRRAWSAASGVHLKTPNHVVVQRSDEITVEGCKKQDALSFLSALTNVCTDSNFVVIDSPGTDTYLSHLGHMVADTLVTPMNDSFVDLDLLGQVDPQTLNVKHISFYSEMVWDSRKLKAAELGGKIDWIVMRNRLAHLDARNKRRVEKALQALSERVGFRLAPGFGERVIFKEMFPSGLTLLDLREEGLQESLSVSHIVARTEVRTLLDTLNLSLNKIKKVNRKEKI